MANFIAFARNQTVKLFCLENEDMLIPNGNDIQLLGVEVDSEMQPNTSLSVFIAHTFTRTETPTISGIVSQELMKTNKNSIGRNL